MNKWVCITKDWSGFTYGRIYEGDLIDNMLDIKNDNGKKFYTLLYDVEL